MLFLCMFSHQLFESPMKSYSTPKLHFVLHGWLTCSAALDPMHTRGAYFRRRRPCWSLGVFQSAVRFHYLINPCFTIVNSSRSIYLDVLNKKCSLKGGSCRGFTSALDKGGTDSETVCEVASSRHTLRLYSDIYPGLLHTVLFV